MHRDAVKRSVVITMNDIESFVNHQKKYKLPNLETSTRCYLRCPQCTRAKLFESKKSSGYRETISRINNGFDLPLEDALKILDFFDQGVMLCGSLSDPVYWPSLQKFIQESKKQTHKKIQIHTAAHQKNLEWYREIFNTCHSNIIWIFGADGLSDSSMTYRVGQNSKLIFDAMILGKQMGLDIIWHYIIFDYNVNQINNAKRLAADKGVKLEFIKSNRSGGGISVPDEYKPERNKEKLKL
jgi:hypothetical protein